MPELVTDLYDLNMLYEQVGKDDAMLKRFIDIFFESVPADMDSLAAALQQNDLNMVRATAHRMKSSYSIMGAEWAIALCAEIEMSAKNGVETEKLPEKFKELSDKFAAMVGRLKEIIF